VGRVVVPKNNPDTR